MLAKCANPACSTPFRRLHEGKLFQVETEFVPREASRRNDTGALAPSRRRTEHFWLCAECAPFVTLAFDRKHGVVTIPLPKGEETRTVRLVDPALRPTATDRNEHGPAQLAKTGYLV